METLRHHFEECGSWMYPLALCFCALAALALDRTLALARGWGPARGLTAELESHLRDGDLGGALALCAMTQGQAAWIASRTLQEALTTPERLRAARQSALLDELPRLEARVGYFATLANLATLFGLMGTVTGLRVGFGCVLNPDAASRATMFAKSISESLNCTAFGLFIAICALTCVLVFRSRIEERVATLRAESMAVVNLAVRYRDRLRLGDQRPHLSPRSYRRAIWPRQLQMDALAKPPSARGTQWPETSGGPST
ncbi:MAG: hypothetical protein SangKO_026670 [Sandaracinaceae bacterium]